MGNDYVSGGSFNKRLFDDIESDEFGIRLDKVEIA